MIKLTKRGKIRFILLSVLSLILANPQAAASGKLLSLVEKNKTAKDNTGTKNSLNTPDDYGYYDDGKNFVFPGGFYLSGFSNGKQWGNGFNPDSSVSDYLPGPAGVSASDNHYSGEIYYRVGSNDTAFGESWQLWKSAVLAGADFYDGDHDGIYNPVDKNKNGKWDPDEDRPDNYGLVTYWRIDNDGLPQSVRRFNDVEPQFINLQKSAFIFSLGGGRIPYIIVRYRIINTGRKAEKLDSVYFSVATQSVSQAPSNYLTGCDTNNNSMFAYSVVDGEQLTSSPCYLISFLQGPIVKIPGVTFIDQNSNGVFDPSIDIPLMKGYNKRGRLKGEDSISGAMNLAMTSFTPYYPNSPVHGTPASQYELRNYMTGGLTKNGTPIDPCKWLFGNASDLNDCSGINPKFMYSGNPVDSNGWLNVRPGREVLFMSTGPFTLLKNVPQDIYVTYVMGQGHSPKNSIEIARLNNKQGRRYFDNNLPDEPLSVENETYTAVKYELEQNYPNPFNPQTKIRYTVSGYNKVTLKVYDLLGKEVAELVNGEKAPGRYEVIFDASRLASGIYFYRLHAGNQILSKKLLLIK